MAERKTYYTVVFDVPVPLSDLIAREVALAVPEERVRRFAKEWEHGRDFMLHGQRFDPYEVCRVTVLEGTKPEGSILAELEKEREEQQSAVGPRPAVQESHLRLWAVELRHMFTRDVTDSFFPNPPGSNAPAQPASIGSATTPASPVINQNFHAPVGNAAGVVHGSQTGAGATSVGAGAIARIRNQVSEAGPFLVRVYHLNSHEPRDVVVPDAENLHVVGVTDDCDVEIGRPGRDRCYVPADRLSSFAWGGDRYFVHINGHIATVGALRFIPLSLS